MTARRYGPILLLALGGCVPSGHLAERYAPAPIFDPIAFFMGSTEGRGSLKVVTRHRKSVLVEGHGVSDGAGGIILQQDVRQGADPTTHRTWHLRRTAANVYAGTLSDATGPVRGEVTGNRLYLSFRMKGGLRAQQWLYLQPGGQVSLNRMIVTKLGLPVAALDETITRQPR